MSEEILLSVYSELIKGASIQRLIDIMCVHLGNPIALCDCNLNPIAYSQDGTIDDFVWTCVTTEDRDLHYEFEEFGKETGTLYKVRNSRVPVLIENPRLVHRYLNISIYHRNNNIGNVILLEYYRNFAESDQELFERFSQILAFSMAKIVPAYDNPLSHASLVMEQLLSGVRVSQKDVSRYLFKQKSGNIYTVVVLKRNPKQVSHRPLSLERDILQQKYPSQRITIYKDTLVMLFQIPQSHGKTNIDWNKFAQMADKMNLLVGISNPFNEITELSLYYDEALNAINCGEQYISGRICYFWQDVSFLYLLSIVQQDGYLPKFCHPAFTTLVEYDSQNNTKWLRTLYYYLYFNGDINTAANAMGINRNSMYYRINKIHEIVGPCFQNSNFISQMKLSMNIYIFLEGESFFQKQEIPPELRTVTFF